MGITILKKGKWILLAFSIALNIGFIFTVASQKATQNFDFPGKHRGPVMAVLDEMALPDNIRNQVTESFRKVRAGQFEFMDKIQPEEEKLLDLLGKPGHLDKKVLDDQIRELNRLRGESMIEKSGHIIAIREQLGPEKTAFLFSEVLKRFRKGFGKRMPKGRRQG